MLSYQLVITFKLLLPLCGTENKNNSDCYNGELEDISVYECGSDTSK